MVHQARMLLAQGKLDQAATLMRRRIGLDPGDPHAHELLGVVLFQLGDLEEGLRCVGSALDLDPAYAEAWNSLGMMRHLSGDHPGAQDAFDRAADLRPGYGEAWMNAGVALQAQGRHEEAIARLQRASATGYANPQVHFFWGNSLAKRERHEEAIAQFRQALKVNPRLGDAWNNLGNSYLALGRYDEAIDALGRAAQMLRGQVLPLINLATALWRIGRVDEALAIVDRAADQPEALRLRAEILGDANRPEEAAGILADLVAHQPDLPEPKASYARALHHMGEWRQVVRTLAAETDPGLRAIAAVTLPAILEDPAMIGEARERLGSAAAALREDAVRLDDPLRQVGLTTFFLAYHGVGERDLQRQVGEMYEALTPRLRFAAGHSAGKGGRKRVGVVSAFMRAHTIGKLFARMFERLDRERFELWYFQIGKVDEVSARFAQSADHHAILAPSLFAAQEQLARAELDVLIFPEVGMDPATYFLAYGRYAPVQCALWGHPMTTGSPAMDWFVSSEHLETPEGDDEYTERLARLPSLTTYFERPEDPPGWTKNELGLPEGQTLYACPQSLFKFHPDFDAVLTEILTRDPRGSLVLIEPNSRNWRTLLEARWRRSAPLLLERAVFLAQVPLPRFLAVCRHADCVLDPIQFGGGNSSLECFAVGAPVVTLPQGLLRNRITYAAYRQIDWLDLVAKDEAGYIDLAHRLGADADFRQSMRSEVRARSAPLFAHQGAVDELSAFLVACSS